MVVLLVVAAVVLLTVVAGKWHMARRKVITCMLLLIDFLQKLSEFFLFPAGGFFTEVTVYMNIVHSYNNHTLYSVAYTMLCTVFKIIF